MILLGRDLSPFTRRCATLLQLLDLPHERRIVNTADDAAAIRQHNPLGRIPTLLLDDEAIVDSWAIVDHLLEVGDADHQRLPAAGVQRRAQLQISAIAVGVMEKGVAYAYEQMRRPPEFVYEPYREQIQVQLRGGLVHLQPLVPSSGWIGGSQPSLGDVDVVVAFDFIGIVAPKVANDAELSKLAGYAKQADQHPAFASTQWHG